MKKTEIEFVSYNGEYPCLCNGKLVLKLNGKKVSFHYSHNPNKKFEDNGKYVNFWTSGGSVSFDEDWRESVLQDDWQLNSYASSKEELEKNYPKIICDNINKILKTFNENVHQGCCGGCV